MQNRFLNAREIKKIREQFLEEYGYFWQKNYLYLLNENEKLSIINRDIVKIDLTKLRVDRFGLYVAEIKNNQVRLSKEGAQLLVQEAKENKVRIKNLQQLTEEEVKNYFQGLDLIKDLGLQSKLLILCFHDDVLGCARYKEGKILNFLSKINRGEVIV